MTYITCRLTVKNRDHLWNPTLGNRGWATFYGQECGVLRICVSTHSVCSFVHVVSEREETDSNNQRLAKAGQYF